MNKIFSIILSCLIFFSLTGSAKAAIGPPPDLVVDFENTPLFSEANFAPGNTVTRFIKVINNTLTSQKIGMEAIKQNNPDALAEQFDLLITQGAATVYHKSLKDFFSDGQIFLTSLDAGAQTQYDLAMTLSSGTGNDFQNKQVGFDLVVGFIGDEGGTTDNPGTPTNTSGGGGGLPQGLTIYENQILVEVSGSTTATISWTTSYNSTSQVIYSVDTGSDPFVFLPPLYGYSFMSAENSTMVTSHSVFLTGLTPATTYRFRVISHASPPTVSFGHTFTTFPELAYQEPTNSGEVAGVNVFPENTKDNLTATVRKNLLAVGDAEKTPVLSGEVLGETILNNEIISQCQNKPWWPWGYAVFVLLAGLGLWLLRKKNKKWFYALEIILFLGVLTWWWFTPCGTRLGWIVIAVLAVVAFLGWIFNKQLKQNHPPQIPPTE